MGGVLKPEQIRGCSAARTDLESFRLGTCDVATWAKYSLEVAAWENALGKVPNIVCDTSFIK